MNTWNAKCIAFFPFFLLFLSFSLFFFCSFVNFVKSLLRIFQSNTLFFSLHCKANDLFFKNKTSLLFFLSDQHYFLFLSLSSKRQSLFRYKTLYFMFNIFLSPPSNVLESLRIQNLLFHEWSPFFSIMALLGPFNGSIWLIFSQKFFLPFYESFHIF